MKGQLEPGDQVRVLDTAYTRSDGVLARCRGQVGTVTAATDTSSRAAMTGFEVIYDVLVGDQPLCLINADVALVARPARIR